jgi:hypothetical protein
MDLIERPPGYIEGQYAHDNPFSSESAVKNNKQK